MNKSSTQKQPSGPARRRSRQNKNQTIPGKTRVAKRKNNGPDQAVSAPISMGRVSTMSRPETKNLPNGDILIKHREYIRDVIGSIDFVAAKFAVNPGLPGVFPWLSTLSNSYESYLFERLEFRFETSSPTTLPGAVILAIDYDPSDTPPIDKTQALAYRNSVRSPTWSSSDHRSLKEDLNKRKTYFVRRGTNPAGTSVASYDVGSLFVCTKGQTGVSVIGELYVDYTVRLMTPQLSNPAVGEAFYMRLTGNTNNTKFSNKVGNLDIEVINISPTVSRWTFRQPWEGYVTFYTSGTVMTVGNHIALAQFAATVTFTNIVSEGAANGQGVSLYEISASQDSVLDVTVANATMTIGSAYFGQADV
jgi:hypothetical protein